jgi:Tol biopolymer transport system component
MSRPEDAVARAVRRAELGVRSEGVIDRLTRRRRRRVMRQRAGSALLAVTVVGGIVLAIPALDRAFRPASSGGQVAFVRLLDPCPAHPNVGGGLDVFSVDVETGEERLVSHVALWPDGVSLRSEEGPDFTPDGSWYVWVDRYRDALYVTDVLTGQTTRLASARDLYAEDRDQWFVYGPGALGLGRPQVSPDGASVVFAAEVGNQIDPERKVQQIEDAYTVFVLAIDGGSAPVAVSAGHLPTWTNDGRIAFARTPTEVRMERMGETTSIETEPLATEFYLIDLDGSNLERVYEAPADVQIADAEWSPDGGRIAAEVTMHGNTDIYVLDLDTQLPLRLTDHPADDTSPTWSPDGSYIAFHTGRYGTFRGHAEIAMVPSSGGEIVRLTHDDCWQDTQPTWIPDPSIVASLPVWTPPPLPDLGEPGSADPTDIVVDASIEGVWDLYAVDPATGETTNLTADVPEQLSPAWSPDRTQVAFAAPSEDGDDLDLFVMNADGTGLRRLTGDPMSESRPSWSPDGTRIAYEVEAGVWVIDADGTDAHRVAGALAGGGHYPSWSPDGSMIVYSMSGEGLFVVHVLSEKVQRITTGENHWDPSWSPDGTLIAFTCEHDICVARPDGTGLTNLTDGDEFVNEAAPDWSPDGSRIVFASDRGPVDDHALWTMDADGSDPRRIELETPLAIHEPNW